MYGRLRVMQGQLAPARGQYQVELLLTTCSSVACQCRRPPWVAGTASVTSQPGASPTGEGRGGRETAAFENRWGRPPQKFGHFSLFFFLKPRINFCFSSIFKTKWPKSEEKLNFGSRWVWMPMTPTPLVKNSWRCLWSQPYCDVIEGSAVKSFHWSVA